MNQLTVFENKDFGEIRTVEIGEEIWFILNDVCTALEIANARDTKARLERDDVGTTDIIDNLGRKQKISIINEYALYECILLSRKPNAKQFKHWITHEVIPAIRKTGSYSLMPKSYAEALRLYADEVEQRELMQKQRDEAIRTKAWISDKKTATAMATASVKSREADKLKIKLDLEMSYATVKKVEMATGRKYNWRNLKKYCESAGIGWNKAFDANYGSVNSYPAEAWKNVYGVEL